MDRTRYTPRDMELTAGVGQPSAIETPRGAGIFSPRNTQTSTVRRNLLGAFEDAENEQNIPIETERTNWPSPVDASTPLGQEQNVELENKTEWSGFVFMWSVIFAIGGLIVFALYKYFPMYMLLCFTREFFISGSLAVLCAILASVVIKFIFQNRKSARQDRRKFVTPRRDRKNVTFDVPSPTSTMPSGRIPTSPEEPISRTGTTCPTPEVPVTRRGKSHQITVKRTFSGDGTDIWSEFIRYFENVAELNEWDSDRKRKVLFTVLRGQAETYAYGLSESARCDWDNLTTALDARFGHKAMKESYVAEAKLRRKKETESFRDFGQAIEDLFRRAYPDNREHVQESSMKTFMDNCSVVEDFRLAVKRTHPKTLQDAVTAAMQEECIRLTENRKFNEKRDHKPPVYGVNIPPHMVNKNATELTVRNTGRENRPRRTCFECNSSEHLYKNCPRRNSNGNNRTGSRGTGNQQLNGNRPRQ